MGSRDPTARLASEVEAECRALRPRLLGYLQRECRARHIEGPEDLCQETLLVYHCRRQEGVVITSHWGFVRRIAHDLMVDTQRRPRVELVELGQADRIGIDPELDVVAGEREEAGDLAEVAAEVLTAGEREVLVLVRLRVRRGVIAKRLGVSERKVKRTAERASAKMRAALQTLTERGRCAMLTLTITDVAEERIGPGHQRWPVAERHLERCGRCRGVVAAGKRNRSTGGGAPAPQEG